MEGIRVRQVVKWDLGGAGTKMALPDAHILPDN
jgi:hypothetical protein